ncbi:MAG: hypothetical protein IJ370_07780 [Oscillospiraceae bacterium]|nr:hypothetical protein [Oscillospiraceae bacterium]
MTEIIVFIGYVVLLVEYIKKRKTQAAKTARFVFETVVDLLLFLCLSLCLIIPKETVFENIISIALLVIIVIKVIVLLVRIKGKKND